MLEAARLLRLNPTAEFEDDVVTGATIVKVTRGAESTRYTVNAAIRQFLECFREPTTLDNVATRLAQLGYDAEKVVAFGRQIAKTPMIEFYDPDNTSRERIDAAIAALGFTTWFVFKEKKFEGVYRVHDRDGKPRVLKLMHSQPNDRIREKIAARLESEFRIIRSLQAVPGVVRSLECGPSPVSHFTMEFVDGVSVFDQSIRSIDENLAMCARVAEIVAGVHELGVIHGDLHTSNFVKRPDGMLTLIDFDCSFEMDGGCAPRAGGAIHFLPPERVIDSWHENTSKPANAASDIYQAAVVMYSLLSNSLPYRGRTMSELTARIRSGCFQPLTEKSAMGPVPADVAAFIHRALDPDPRRRPSTLREFPYAGR
jgi:serine/threonine protein kinase